MPLLTLLMAVVMVVVPCKGMTTTATGLSQPKSWGLVVLVVHELQKLRDESVKAVGIIQVFDNNNVFALQAARSSTSSRGCR